jgi:hypothetical protein
MAWKWFLASNGALLFCRTVRKDKALPSATEYGYVPTWEELPEGLDKRLVQFPEDFKEE